MRKQGSRSSEVSSSSEEAKRSPPIRWRLGRLSSFTVTYLSNTPTSLVLCTTVSTPESVLFILPIPPLIVLLYTNTLKLTERWSPTSSRKAVTSAHVLVWRSRHLLARSSPLLSPGSQNLASLANTGPCTISLFLIPPPPRSLPSTAPLTLMLTHAPGVPSLPYASPSTTFHLAPRLPFATLLKPIAQFPSILISGLAWWSSCWTTTNSPSTFATTLDLHQLAAYMVKWEMQLWIYFVRMGWDPSQNGSTTIFSSVFSVSLLFSTSAPSPTPSRSAPCRLQS